jgi:hypothetical protein
MISKKTFTDDCHSFLFMKYDNKKFFFKIQYNVSHGSTPKIIQKIPILAPKRISHQK